MRERDIEAYLDKAVRKMGGFTRKWVSPGHAGVPDRLVFVPPWAVFAVEVKAPGKKPTKQQEREHARLRNVGMDVFVIDSIEDVHWLLDDE